MRVRVPDVGGAFGSKGTLPVETPVVALAAERLGRPVKWAEDRYENFVSAPQGRGQRGALELALDADGRSSRCAAGILADLGAYLLPSTAIPPHTTAMLLSGCYDIPAVEVFVTGVRTNRVPTGPYRGAGRPEATYLIETTLDAAARELGIDPVELRRRNLVRAFPYRTALGWTYDSGDFERCLDTRARAARDAAAAALAVRAQLALRPLLGVGAGRCGRGGGSWASPPPEPASDVVRGHRRRAVRRALRRAVRARDGHPRRRRLRGRGRLDALRPGPRDAVRADRRRPARRRPRARARCHRRHRRDRAGRRLLRQPLDGDGRLRGRRGGRGSAGGRAGRGPLRVRPGLHLRRLRGGRRGRRAPPAAVRVSSSSPSTTPAGSSTRCWPRARSSAARSRGSARCLTEEAGPTSLLDYGLLTAAELPREFATAFVQSRRRR